MAIVPEIILRLTDEEYTLLDSLARKSGITAEQVVKQTIFTGHKACCVATGEVFLRRHTETLKLFGAVLRDMPTKRS